jgi:capsular polysaccharide export protein
MKYLQSDRPSYYLLPLQLETDYQIRRHSRFKSMAHVMEVTMESFARGAPKNSLLVVKLHPLDNGIANFRKQARRIAKRLKLDNRVLVMDGGHLPTLLSRCKGVVVVNSTTGLSALHHGRPVTVLGSAIFDLPGLTFKGSFDRFWKWAKAPDKELFRAFRRVVLTKAQVNGSFFTDEGLDLAIEGTLKRLDVASATQPAAQARPSVAPSLAPANDAILIR